jgi:eukaryotic-like serine/threonine-protein kinase
MPTAGGVLHRDLKPGNIMLGKFGETLVVDWGLAKSVGRPEAAPASATMDDRTLVPQSGSDLRGTELGARLGTPAYMSPEQAAGRIDELGPASDVYSLGATLYCLLTGRAPFNDQDLPELLRKVEQGEFSPPRKLKGWIDPALEAVGLKAMATKPAQRYRTPRVLADDVEHWLADEPVSAWREPIRRRLRRWSRRHRLLVTGLGATLVVAVAALAVGNVLVAQQRDRAERSLAFARTVVDEMYTGVADKLDDQEQMDDYQREILEKALKFYERFALPQSRDPRVRLEAAHVGMRVGGIRSRLGETAAAEEAYRQAFGILSRLVSEHAAEPAYRDALAQAHQGIGVVLHDEERWGDSEREYKAAAAVWDELAREYPNIAPYRSKLANVHGSLAHLYRLKGGKLDEAEAEFRLAREVADRLNREAPDEIAYQESLAKILNGYGLLRRNQGDLGGSEAAQQRAVAITEKLARNRPDVTKHQLGLAHCLASLGQTFYHEDKFPQAEEALNRSITILEKLAADHPQDMKISADLGSRYDLIAEILTFRGDLQSALEWAGRAIPLYRSLARRDPHNLQIGQTGLGGALATRAEHLVRLGRHADAVADFEEVVVLSKGNRSSELFRAFHALTKARLGDLSALALVDREIRDTFTGGKAGARVYPFYWMNCYDAGCLFAALAKLSLQDQGRTVAERQRLSQRDFERALDLLDRMRAPGEFGKAIPLDEIRKEPLLDPLRTDPRFQLLMMDLAFPYSPFATEGGPP